ncbi:MAG TPA: hypothetical protein HPP97_00495 [Desulfuromonadales bacterium]|nr:hypothetical protein [Desulfuromonadales bacterium]
MRNSEEDTLRSEYSRAVLGKGVRGKHSAAFQKGSNLVVLQDDVAKAFSTSEAVNEALRALLRVTADTYRLTHCSSKATRKQVTSS